MVVSSVDSILPDGKAGYRVESVQDFLIKLDMKPYTYASSGIKPFSLNLFIVRPNEIVNRDDKN